MSNVDLKNSNDKIKINGESYKLNSDTSINLRNFSIKSNLNEPSEIVTCNKMLVDGKEVTIPPMQPTVLTGRMVQEYKLKDAKELVIPEGIKSIEPLALSGSKIERLVLPKGFKKIGEGALSHCVNLREIKCLGKDGIEIEECAIDLREGIITKDNSTLIITGNISVLAATSISGASKIVISGNVDKLSLKTYDTKTMIISGNVNVVCDSNLAYAADTSILNELIILGDVNTYKGTPDNNEAHKVDLLHIGGKKPDNLLQILKDDTLK